MVLPNEMKGLLEVFSIDTENFSLWATLNSIEGGRSWVFGWVKFNNREKSRFSGEDTDPSALRKRLLSMCEPIAAFYGGELIHRKVPIAPGAKRDDAVTIQESRLLN